jgi:hypothetical protein
MSIPTERSGKGDTYRPVNKKKYDENYVRVFGKDCKNCFGIGEVRVVTPDDETEIKGEEVQPCPFCNGLGRIKKERKF